MTVLVTRPGEQGKALCQQLANIGLSALHHPLINIEAGTDLPHLIPDIHQCDVIIAVSQHAVIFSDQFLRNQRSFWSPTVRYLAVGQKTAHLLSKATGQSVNYPQVSDSEHLLKLTELQAISGKNIIILRGNGGRELINETLTQRGGRIQYKEVYRRVDIPFSARQCVESWQQAKVDSLVITSSHQLTFFMSQFDETELAWVYQLTLIVPSQRIALDAKALGFKHIVTACSATNPDLVAALQP